MHRPSPGSPRRRTVTRGSSESASSDFSNEVFKLGLHRQRRLRRPLLTLSYHQFGDDEESYWIKLREVTIVEATSHGVLLVLANTFNLTLNCFLRTQVPRFFGTRLSLRQIQRGIPFLTFKSDVW